MRVPERPLEPPYLDTPEMACSECGSEYEPFYNVDGSILCESCAKREYVKNNYTVKKVGECESCGKVAKLYEHDDGYSIDCVCRDCVWDADKIFKVKKADYADFINTRGDVDMEVVLDG